MDKNILTVFVNNIFSIGCLVIAGILVYNKMEGWGWFLFAGLITLTWLKKRSSETDDDDKES